MENKDGKGKACYLGIFSQYTGFNTLEKDFIPWDANTSKMPVGILEKAMYHIICSRYVTD